MMSDIEDRLYEVIRNLRAKNERLERELSTALTSLSNADFRIEQELEPRIKAERRSYDAWVTSPDRGGK